MKKILVISSTPRKGGNSDILCDQFILGAEEAGNSTEKVLLKSLKINFCSGCGVCNTIHKCTQSDDMADLLEKMIAADVIVLATPVYFYSVCAQLKVMIDRVCPRYTEIANKRFYLLATAAENGDSVFAGTIACYQGLLDCLPGSIDAGKILAGGAFGVGEVRALPIMNGTFVMGKSV